MQDPLSLNRNGDGKTLDVGMTRKCDSQLGM